MVGDVLVNTHSFDVLRHNLWYFLAGRNAGLVPYFFPGMLAVVLFLFSKQKHFWQWLALGTIAVIVVMHVFVWPFTWNGGGGPVGSRYFLPFYALFLVLIPATAGIGRSDDGVRRRCVLYSAARAEPVLCVAAAGRAHQIRDPADAADRADAASRPSCGAGSRPDAPAGGPARTGAARVGVFRRRQRVPPEETGPKSNDWWFWVKGNAKAEIVLRAPIASLGDNDWVTKAISRVTLEVRNGGAANRVTVATGSESQTFAMTPGELRVVTLAVPAGVPFRREIQPTSYLYNHVGHDNSRLRAVSRSAVRGAGQMPEQRSAIPRRDDSRRPGVH